MYDDKFKKDSNSVIVVCKSFVLSTELVDSGVLSRRIFSRPIVPTSVKFIKLTSRFWSSNSMRAVSVSIRLTVLFSVLS